MYLRCNSTLFEERRSAIVVVLRFKSFNFEREHRLGVGSFKDFECEVIGYKRVKSGAGSRYVCVRR